MTKEPKVPNLDPAHPKGDMGKGSFEQSTQGDEKTPPNVKGPHHVDVTHEDQPRGK